MTTLRGTLRAAVAAAGVALLLAGCGAPGPGALTALPRTPQAPFPDEGDPARVAAVKRFVVAALSAEVDVYRHTDAAGGLSATDRVAEAGAFEAPHLASRVTYDSPIGWGGPFVSARFRPVRWDGVAVRDGLAKVYVVGHDEFLTLDGGAYRGSPWQYQLLLRREPGAAHGWLLVAEAAVGGDRVASLDPAAAPAS
jgi:hypothetical protein